MNEIKKNSMTSLEIAELTGKNHFDVLKAIRKMEPAWVKVNGSNFALVDYSDAKGEKRPIYELSKTECLYIATKFNDEARAKLVLRWEKLENERQAAPIPVTRKELALMVIQQEEQIELLESQKKVVEAEKELYRAISDNQDRELKAAAPKIEYYHTVLLSAGTMTTTLIAKEKGMSAFALNKLLNEKGIIYKQGKTWFLYAKYQDKGYAEMRTFTHTNDLGITYTEHLLVWTELGRHFVHSLLQPQKQTA